MRGERSTVTVDHAIGVAVVGGDAGHAAHFSDRVGYLLNAPVDCLDRLDCRVEHTGVTDHVAVGEVEDDHVILAALDRFDALFGDLVGAHMGLHVVGGDRRGLDEDAILALILLFNAAVEEEGDVRILLGLGNTQLGQAVVGEILAEGVDELLRLEGDLNVGHGRVILRHADVGDGETAVPALKSAEIVIDKGAGDLARSVGTEVVEDDAVVCFDSVAARDHGRQHELVGHAVVIAVLHRLYGIGLLYALAVDNRGICLFDALPAIISVHRVVTSADGSDLADADLGALFDSLRHILLRAGRGHVTTVEERVYVDLRKTLALGKL